MSRVICGFKWMAPYYLPAPSTKVESLQQLCILTPGHLEDHRSATKVTTPRKKEKS